MKIKVIFVPLAMLLSACQSTSILKPEPVAAIEPVQKTSLFYYYVNPVKPAQSTAVVEGRFAWKEGCLYLVGKDGVYNTAMFPLYPKDIFRWDEATKALNLNGHIFNMGDSISTNGHYSDYVPKSAMGIEYENQGDKKCLMPTLVMIGTMSLDTK